MIRIIFICSLLVGCVGHQDKTLLRWKIDSDKGLSYNAAIEEIPSEKSLRLHGFDIIENPELRIEMQNKLELMELPSPVLLTTINKIEEDKLRVKTVSVSPQYSEPAKNEQEEYQREAIKSQVGTVQILADISTSGDLKSFYLRQKQRNLMALFFKLPTFAVGVGDSWSVPVNSVEIGLGFVPNDLQRINQVTLDDIVEDASGDHIAHLSYILSDGIEGQYEYSYSDTVVPMTVEFSYIGFGEFNIEKGTWKRFVAQSFLTGTGLSQSENSMRYMLEPVEGL